MKEKSVSPTVVKQLLALLRSSLWHTAVDCKPFNSLHVDWNEIGKLAMRQTVGPLVFDAALRLPSELMPPKSWILKAYSIVERNRRTHLLLDNGVADACAKLSKTGIRAVLLKGQAYACAYPDPALRQCGDIDLYVGELAFRRAYEAAKDFGWRCDMRFYPEDKHYACVNNDVIIELHRIAAQLPSRSANRVFQQWSRKQLGSGGEMTIGGKIIEVPTPLFDVVFVFMHLHTHFFNRGVGLRQICDWVMLLHSHFNVIDVAQLKGLLKEFNLLRSWYRFAPIAVDYLGLPENECPLYSTVYREEAERIFSVIIKDGNFGKACKSSVRPKGYLASKAYSLRLIISWLYPKFRVDPETVMSYFCAYAISGSKRIIKEVFAKR